MDAFEDVRYAPAVMGNPFDRIVLPAWCQRCHHRNVIVADAAFPGVLRCAWSVSVAMGSIQYKRLQG